MQQSDFSSQLDSLPQEDFPSRIILLILGSTFSLI